MCALNLSHLDDFSDKVTYILSIITIFLGEKLGILGRKLLPLRYLRKNPENL